MQYQYSYNRQRDSFLKSCDLYSDGINYEPSPFSHFTDFLLHFLYVKKYVNWRRKYFDISTHEGKK